MRAKDHLPARPLRTTLIAMVVLAHPAMAAAQDPWANALERAIGCAAVLDRAGDAAAAAAYRTELAARIGADAADRAIAAFDRALARGAAEELPAVTARLAAVCRAGGVP